MSDDFSEHRQHLFGIAYRMLGTSSDAEDMVQEAYLRWSRQDAGAIRSPRAYLSKIVARLSIDRLRAVKARRESYVGIWLPEPLVSDEDPARVASLTPAFMLLLERLTPAERAALILRDVFELDYDDIGEVIDRSPEATRQIASRARARVTAERERFEVDRQRGLELAARFFAAAHAGDLDGLVAALREDVRAYSDGGGKASAAVNVLAGTERVARYVIGAGRRFTVGLQLEPAELNGLPGLIMRRPDGSVHGTIAVESDGEAVTAVYLVRNPDKLRHLYRY